ncbi:ROK family protein [Arthrobacter sp. TS-15]|uniref:ROK family protein n=1 Tax=Arthrobacter sp. TS-15 TaxID=2510797 RepID=UPI00115D6553|nr:ROK family protein [Arthrobacter sp. TS-15]TQS87570.1 ROK family protein [Arthrobacter sp. TS-15]
MVNVAMHAAFDEILESLVANSGVSRSVLASVLVRAMVVAPSDVVRADIAKGTMLGRPKALNPGAVSKAVAALLDDGLLSEEPLQPDNRRAGRPVKPLHLGSSSWALIGIKIVHSLSKPTALTGVVMTLGTDILGERDVDLPRDVTFETVAEHVAALVQTLTDELANDEADPGTVRRRILAVGIDVASHVENGRLIGATHMGLPVDEDYDLTTPLEELLGLPVVVDNDVNNLAVREMYRSKYTERDIALVAVFQDGVGGALILDGHVYRGGGGMAAEPGHQTVQISLGRSPQSTHELRGLSGFSAPCHCERAGHIDCYAVPARILAEVPEATSFAEAAKMAGRGKSGKLTRAGWSFMIGGQALGQGIASIINVVNPSRVVLILPSDLAPENAPAGAAAAEYLQAVEEAVTKYSFSSGAERARAGSDMLTIDVLDESEVRLAGATSAAVRAFDTFISHARGRDECSVDLGLAAVRSIA